MTQRKRICHGLRHGMIQALSHTDASGVRLLNVIRIQLLVQMVVRKLQLEFARRKYQAAVP